MADVSQQPQILQSRHFALIPGTEKEEDLPATSLELYDLVIYRAQDVVEFLSALDQVIVLQGGEEDWYRWLWRWGTKDRYIIINFTLFDGHTPEWGGSSLDINCYFSELVGFWERFRERFPASILHDGRDNSLYTVSSFIEDYAIPLLKGRRETLPSNRAHLITKEVDKLTRIIREE